MFFTLENTLLVGSILLLIGIVSTKISRLGIPVVLLFIGLGMLAGSDGIGGIYFDNPKVTKFIGSIALCIILFSGGISTRLTSSKTLIFQGLSLSFFGVIITAGIIGSLSHFIFGFTWIEGFLIGSIVSSTDAASVFAILKSRKNGIKNNLKFLIEFESGSNDPMAYLLTILFASILSNNITSAWDISIMFFQQMIFGILIGVAIGYLSVWLINRINLDFEGLYSVLLLALSLFSFSFSEYVGGNSFLAVYLMGLVLGNRDFVHKRSLTKHFDGHAWFMQILMFLTLGLLVFPTKIVPLIPMGIVFSLCLIFVARPIAVFLSLIPFKDSLKSKFFISWVGLRGSVPIILAIYVYSFNLPISNMIFNLVFFISIASVVIQGSTFSLMAKWLDVVEKSHNKIVEGYTGKAKRANANIFISSKSHLIGKKIIDLYIPEEITIVCIKRNDTYLIHDGSFIFEENDTIQVIADNEKELTKFREKVNKSFKRS